MKINKAYQSIIFISFLFFSLSCQKFIEIKTDDYTIKVPKSNTFETNIKKDTTNIDIQKNKNIYSIWVIRKNKFEYLSMNDCVSKELEFFIEGKKTANIITKKTRINGYDAKIISGVTKDKPIRYFWTFAVFQKNFYYYILRIYSTESKYSFNEYTNSKIIHSFHLK